MRRTRTRLDDEAGGRSAPELLIRAHDAADSYTTVGRRLRLDIRAALGAWLAMQDAADIEQAKEWEAHARAERIVREAENAEP